MTAQSEALAQLQTDYAGIDLPLGAVITDGEPHPDVVSGFNLATLNRHALIAGATGTGKTRTVQLLAERLSQAGVPCLVTDVKGDLTGLAQAGEPSEKLLARTTALGQEFTPRAFPVNHFGLGQRDGQTIPVRTTVTQYGPLLLARALELNQTQTQALQLIFHWADSAGLELYNLADLKATITFLTGAGREYLQGIGGVSAATAGVILRAVSTLEIQDGDIFFGQPDLDTADLIATTPTGAGVINVLEVPLGRPALMSTFIMWILADLFGDLPEVGDTDKPRFVLFFDEAHLLFSDASKEFLAHVVQIVKLIRSKGVGIVFITQSPTDIPDEVLGQLGSRIQHALRAHTPREAKALKAAVDTFPRTDFDLGELITSLGTGEAIITGLNRKGVPLPVAPTRLFAPEAVMGPAAPEVLAQLQAGNPLAQKYGTSFDADSAAEKIARGAVGTQSAPPASAPNSTPAPGEPQAMDEQWATTRTGADQPVGVPNRAPEAGTPSDAGPTWGQEESALPSALDGMLGSFARSLGTQLGREISRTVFGTSRRSSTRRSTSRSTSRRSTRSSSRSSQDNPFGGWW